MLIWNLEAGVGSKRREGGRSGAKGQVRQLQFKATRFAEGTIPLHMEERSKHRLKMQTARDLLKRLEGFLDCEEQRRGPMFQPAM
jgi:hypothetical protein